MMKKMILMIMIILAVQTTNGMEGGGAPAVNQPTAQPNVAPQDWRTYLSGYLPTMQGIKRSMPYWPAAVTAIPPAVFALKLAGLMGTTDLSDPDLLGYLTFLAAMGYSGLLSKMLGRPELLKLVHAKKPEGLVYYLPSAMFFGTPLALGLGGYLYNRYRDAQKSEPSAGSDQPNSPVIP